MNGRAGDPMKMDARTFRDRLVASFTLEEFELVMLDGCRVLGEWSAEDCASLVADVEGLLATRAIAVSQAKDPEILQLEEAIGQLQWDELLPDSSPEKLAGEDRIRLESKADRLQARTMSRRTPTPFEPGFELSHEATREFVELLIARAPADHLSGERLQSVRELLFAFDNPHGIQLRIPASHLLPIVSGWRLPAAAAEYFDTPRLYFDQLANQVPAADVAHLVAGSLARCSVEAARRTVYAFLPHCLGGGSHHLQEWEEVLRARCSAGVSRGTEELQELSSELAGIRRLPLGQGALSAYFRAPTLSVDLRKLAEREVCLLRSSAALLPIEALQRALERDAQLTQPRLPARITETLRGTARKLALDYWKSSAIGELDNHTKTALLSLCLDKHLRDWACNELPHAKRVLVQGATMSLLKDLLSGRALGKLSGLRVAKQVPNPLLKLLEKATGYRNSVHHEDKPLHPHTGAELHELLFGAKSTFLADLAAIRIVEA